MSVLELNEGNFEKEVLQSDKVVLIDFYATWCGPCKMQSPIVDEIAEEKQDIKVAKIDIDNNASLAEKYEIMSIPTLLVLKNGEVKKQFVGLTTKNDICDSINSL